MRFIVVLPQLDGLSPEVRLRDEQWCIALLNTLSVDQVGAVLKAFNASRGEALSAGGSAPRVEPLTELLADLKELEGLYNTDRVAQSTASQIERIFDKWLYPDQVGVERSPHDD